MKRRHQRGVEVQRLRRQSGNRQYRKRRQFGRPKPVPIKRR
jgi:hypothetical protein